MDFAAPSLLWLAAVLPLLALIGVRLGSRRIIPVDSLLLWRVVAARLANTPRRTRRADPVTLLVTAACAFGLIAFAEPQIPEASSAPDLRVFADASGAALLETPQGAPALALDVAREAGLTVAPANTPGSDFDEAGFQSWLASNDSGQMLFISPRRLSWLPAGVLQATHGADPASLPFEHIETAGGWLYARTTRPGSCWILAEVAMADSAGKELARLTASGREGREILAELPVSGEHIELRLEHARPGRDRAYLWRKPPLRLDLSGVPADMRRAFSAAYGMRAEIGAVPENSRADMTLVSGSVPGSSPTLRVAGGMDVRAIDTEGAAIIQADSPLLRLLPSGWLEPRDAERALSALPGDETLPLLSIVRPGEPPALLIALLPQRREILTSLDLTGSLRGRAWLPLLLAGACELLTGRNPVTESAYAIEWRPAESGAVPLMPLQPSLGASPLPGLYRDGVVNALAPDPAQVHTSDILPDLSKLTGAPRHQSLAWLGSAAAFGCLGVVAWSMRRGLRAMEGGGKPGAPYLWRRIAGRASTPGQ